MTAISVVFALVAVTLGGPKPGIYKLPMDCSAISADGSTVVGSVKANVGEPCLWTREKGRQIIHVGNHGGLATGVSADGSVIAGRIERKDGTWLFVKVRGAAPRLLWRAWSEAVLVYVSADGKWVVGNDPNARQNGLWSVDRGTKRLLPEWFSPNCISADGSFMAGSYPLGERERRLTSTFELGAENVACIWSRQTGLLNMGRPNPWRWTEAKDCSDNGQVVCGNGGKASPFSWSPGLGYRELALPPRARSAKADFVSADGKTIVGGAWYGPDQDFAAIWREGHGGSTLSKYASEVGVDVRGWQLGFVYGMSSDGTHIIGDGFDSKGKPCNWLVDIPKPKTPSQPAITIKPKVDPPPPSQVQVVDSINGTRLRRPIHVAPDSTIVSTYVIEDIETKRQLFSVDTRVEKVDAAIAFYRSEFGDATQLVVLPRGIATDYFSVSLPGAGFLNLFSLPGELSGGLQVMHLRNASAVAPNQHFTIGIWIDEPPIPARCASIRFARTDGVVFPRGPSYYSTGDSNCGMKCK